MICKKNKKKRRKKKFNIYTTLTSLVFWNENKYINISLKKFIKVTELLRERCFLCCKLSCCFHGDFQNCRTMCTCSVCPFVSMDSTQS